MFETCILLSDVVAEEVVVPVSRVVGAVDGEVGLGIAVLFLEIS